MVLQLLISPQRVAVIKSCYISTFKNLNATIFSANQVAEKRHEEAWLQGARSATTET